MITLLLFVGGCDSTSDRSVWFKLRKGATTDDAQQIIMSLDSDFEGELSKSLPELDQSKYSVTFDYAKTTAINAEDERIYIELGLTYDKNLDSIDELVEYASPIVDNTISRRTLHLW